MNYLDFIENSESHEEREIVRVVYFTEGICSARLWISLKDEINDYDLYAKTLRDLCERGILKKIYFKSARTGLKDFCIILGDSEII